MTRRQCLHTLILRHFSTSVFQTLPQSTTDEENNDNNRKKTMTIHSTVQFRSVYKFEQSLVSDDFKIRYQMLYIYVM